jgi:hypothetical protein
MRNHSPVKSLNVLRRFVNKKNILNFIFSGFVWTNFVAQAQIPSPLPQQGPISFRLEVMPTLTKAGCNTGACHGSAQGKDGFQLSLFGFDPEGDYYRLSREMPGRRIQLAAPSESLMLKKALGTVQHTGGNVISRQSPAYQTLLQWLQQGAPDDPAEQITFRHLAIEPATLTLNGSQQKQNLRVWATMSDNTKREVTALIRWTSSDDQIAKISPQGEVVSGDSGEALIMARCTTATAAISVVVIPSRPSTSNYGEPKQRIDQLVVQKLALFKIPVSPICDDDTFLRRATIDCAGRQATEKERQSYYAWPVEQRRENLIDELLKSEAFSRLWVMKWSELLGMSSADQNKMSFKSVQLYGDWLRQAIHEDRPWDLMVRQLLTGSGGTFEFPQTNYFRQETDPLKMAENVAQVFMGTRIQCAQCHNHPFDRWTMEDYYGFAAFMGRIGVKNGRDPREKIIVDKSNGEVKHPLTNKPVPPRFLGGEQPELQPNQRRQKLAQWLTAPENPWFAKHMANMIWAWFMGRGIVEPVDDVRLSNPPSNEALLQYLAKVFKDHHFRIRPLVKEICLSQTYQRSSSTVADNEVDERYFSHAPIRRVRSEVLWDMLCQATDNPQKLPGLPKGESATALIDGKLSDHFLKTFGRASHQSVCSCEVVTEPNLSQALNLLNGDMVQASLEKSGLIAKYLKTFSPEETFQKLTWKAYNRQPSAEEVEYFKQQIDTTPPLSSVAIKEILEDFYWAMLNGREFAFVY